MNGERDKQDGATCATREDDTSDPSRFSRKSCESRAKTEIRHSAGSGRPEPAEGRFTLHEAIAFKRVGPRKQ